MKIILEKQENKVILNVTFNFRGKYGSTEIFSNSDAAKWINKNHPELALDTIISCPTKPIDNISRFNGSWIFGLQNTKLVDNKNSNDTINKSIEAESLNEKKINDASLPNGLKKITKTKRKRATKKKTTEE